MKKIILIINLVIINYLLFAQIPQGYYDGTEGLNGDDLKSALNDIIDGHTELSYTGVWDALRNTDEDPDNTDNVILLYTGWSVSDSGYPIWNREHVWAKSHGDFGDSPPCGTDVHHLRPTDVQVNGDRGNLDFDYSDNPYTTIPGCYYDSNSWEPRDEVKGDVARMIFYMATRYEGENGELDLVVVDEVNTYPNPEHGKLSALLEWNTMDPPSEFEEERNDRIYDNWQGNRNPFVDHPEFADYIWGSGQPEIIADFYADITVGSPPLSVQYTDTSIGENIISWSWDLDGDGYEDSNLQDPSYNYQSTGFYTVTLTIEDDAGNTDTETKIDYINVSTSLPEVIFSESFESTISEWSVISMASDHDWQQSDDTTNYTHPSTVPDGDWYMYANNYGADEPAIDWLISPTFNLSIYDNPYCSFQSWTKYSDSIVGLEFKITTNYTGNPNTTSWNNLNANLSNPNSSVWEDSGEINLSVYTNEQNVRIAFHYQSTGTGANTTTAWAIDDLNVMGYEPTSAEEIHITPNYALSNYPNPFIVGTSGTQISFNLSQNSQNAQIEIFNIKGQKIKSFPINQLASSLIYQIIWDGTDKNNKKVKTGIYLINLQIDNINAITKKCLVIH